MILFILYVNACENFFFRKIDGKCIFFGKITLKSAE